MISFHVRLRQLRESAGLKQSDLAERLNLKSAAISKYEVGTSRPDLDTIIQMSKIFDVSADYILGLSDYPHFASDDKLSFNRDDVSLLDIYKKLPINYQHEVKGYINGILSSIKRTHSYDTEMSSEPKTGLH